jgi:hypothetical protein
MKPLNPRMRAGYAKDRANFTTRMEDGYGEAFDLKAVLPEDPHDYQQHLLLARCASPANINWCVSAPGPSSPSRPSAGFVNGSSPSMIGDLLGKGVKT